MMLLQRLKWTFGRSCIRMLCSLTLGALLSVLATQPAGAQDDLAAGSQRASRADLLVLVGKYEALINGGTLRGERLQEERARQAAVRQRLERGDFQVGDRFVVTLRHDSMRVDTASVRDSLQVSLFSLPDFSVAGVLRSELDDILNAHVSRYLRNASARANVLTRVSISGAVRAPGFYWAAPDRPLSDLLMLAGGPIPEAQLNEVEVLRGTVQLLSRKKSKRVLEQGATLEQLDVQSGDQVRVPTKRARPKFQSVVQLLFVFSSLFFAALQFIQWYYNRQEG